MTWRALLLCALSAALVGCPKKPAAKPTLKIAAASDLSQTFTEIGKAYEAKTGQKVVFSFGASGMLERQVADRAPFDGFAAANVAFVDDAITSGACLPESKGIYAIGTLGMWTRAAGKHPATLNDLTSADYKKIAIANPEHAPYGKAAKQALVKAGVWDQIAPKIVYGENVQQTFEFARSGNADVALLRYSPPEPDGSNVKVDRGLYDPLEQAIAVCRGGGANDAAPHEGAKDFVAFVLGPDGKAVLQNAGFDVR